MGGSLLLNSAHAQITVDSFFRACRPFIAMHYSQHDWWTVSQWSDSMSKTENKEFRIKNQYYRGKMVTTDKTTIEFLFYFSRLGRSSDNKLVGTVSVYGGSKDLFPVYRSWFDSVWTEYDSSTRVTRQFFRFYKYSNPTNLVLERVDPAITGTIKYEYFDLYFTNLNKSTSKWQTYRKNFMQPYSNTFIALMKKGNIQGMLDIINLKNKGFSWFLAEGLWYYNSLHPCLTPEQLSIVDSYNGKGGLIAFRPKNELEKIYTF
jgi:hypothetical protein